MVGQAIQKSTTAFSGLRPVNAARDLPDIGRLMNRAFRDEFDGELAWMRAPMLGNLSAYLWALSFMPAVPNGIAGFVWEEDGHIVGNVTLTPEEGRPGYWLISNVAVDEKYRRQGLARALMQASLDEAKKKNARSVMLQVRPHNSGAIRLYEQLGFDVIDTAMRYRRSFIPSHSFLASRQAESSGLRRLESGEYAAAYQLAKNSLPTRLQTLRPFNPGAFAIHFDDRVTEAVVDFLSGQKTMRWGFFNGERLEAVLTVRAQRFGSFHNFEIFVHPEARGHLEAWLVTFALEQLSEFPKRPVQIEAWSSHAELVSTILDQGFFAQKGLTLMVKDFLRS